MFALNQNTPANEMQRVLKKGVVKGFATWPPEIALGRIYAMISTYASLFKTIKQCLCLNLCLPCSGEFQAKFKSYWTR
jgi:hypothetical protein